MNYIDAIAERIYRFDGATSAPTPDDLALYRIYAVLALAKGEETTLEDVHDAWSAWTAERRPEHPALIPFASLSFEKQELDRPYVQAIHAIARELDNEQAA